jgi:hypothetical protein
MRALVQAVYLSCVGILAHGCAKAPASSPAPARPRDPDPGPGTPDTIRTTIANDCPRPVSVAFGKDPPGEHAPVTRLPAGSEQIRELAADERLWLLRDDGTWAAGASVEADGGRITILATCSAVGTIEPD